MQQPKLCIRLMLNFIFSLLSILVSCNTICPEKEKRDFGMGIVVVATFVLDAHSNCNCLEESSAVPDQKA